MYLLNLAHFWGANALPMGVLTPSEWSKSVPMCLRNLQKNLVHGALIDVEILTSPFPHVFAQLGPYFGGQCSAHGCVNTFQVSKSIPMCCRNLHKHVGAWGPNRGPYLGLILCTWVCQHLPSGLKVFLCAS